jgi:hypothetical protein
MPEQAVNPHLPYTLNLFADYYQLYLQDEQDTGEQPDDWGDQLVTRMIAVAPGIIGIGTARNKTVPVSIDLFNGRPDDDFSTWDHVAEASLEVPSGQIVIAGCSDYFPDATRIAVIPGEYRVRIYYGGLGSISEDGLDGKDHYRVVIWPEENNPPEILKKWPLLRS